MKFLALLIFVLLGLGSVASPSHASELRTSTRQSCAFSDATNCHSTANPDAGIARAQHEHYQVQVGQRMCTVYASMRYNHRNGSCTYAFTEDTGTSASPVLKGEVKLALTRPCAEEDSPNCHWDAGTSGNGEGHSFSSLRVGHLLCTIYDDPTYNHKQGYCTTY
jgi:hypothetical protein